jgi:hypothetical protein
MTVFYSHHDRLGHLAGGNRRSIASSWQAFTKRLGALARRASGRTAAAFKIVHQAIVTAKTRRLARELMLHADSRDDRSLEPRVHESRDADTDVATLPQRPLILGDKWDF